MKDAAHHLKHVQKKVIQNARKEELNNKNNGVNLDASLENFSLPYTKRPASEHRTRKGG